MQRARRPPRTGLPVTDEGDLPEGGIGGGSAIPLSSPARARRIRRVLWLTLGLNLLVAGAKIAAGTITATLSLVADGYHSLLDGSGNILGLITLRFADRPPDEDHQYGHRKFEVLASMGISILLFATAAQIVMEALERFRTSSAPSPSWISLTTALVTLGVNLSVTLYESRMGRRLRSPFLLADAEHTRSDVYSTLGVLGAILMIRAGYPWADPITAAAIGAVIVRAGWKILTSGVNVIADRRVIDPNALQAVALSFGGVRSCSRVRTRGFEDAAFLDLTVVLDPHLSLMEAHDLCDEIEAALHRRFPQLVDIVIHPEPEIGSEAQGRGLDEVAGSQPS
jgi:cation diffusion facilitator family transporter